MNLIKEKKQVFNDLRIPWNKEIEQTFKREKKNSIDPQHTLDRICKPYLEYAFEHEAETYYAWLKEKYGDRTIPRKVIKKEIGEENFYLLYKAGLIEVTHDKERYILKGK